MKTGYVAFLGLCFAVAAAACSSPATTGNPGTAGTPASGTAGAGGTVSCAPDQTLCGSACLNTASDSDNCGGCGIPCLAGHTCQASQCKCPAGLLECNGSCVASDAAHCGTCTNAWTGTEGGRGGAVRPGGC